MGVLLQARVHMDADSGKASLMDVPQPTTCFTPNGVQQSHILVLSVGVLVVMWWKCHVTLPRHTYNLSFGRGNPEPSPLLLSFWTHLGWPYWTWGGLSSGKDDWQGESREWCNPCCFKKVYWSVISCKFPPQKGVSFTRCFNFKH